MGRTFLRQDVQIAPSDVYDDTIAPTEAAYETNPGNIEDDLNSVRSMLSHLRDAQVGDWFDALVAPAALEAGTIRGVQDNNDALHAIEKKRFLRCYWGLDSISIASAGDTFDVLGTGELPGNTTAAVGAVTTLGTVVADNSGGFGAASLVEVAGTTAINPDNMVEIVDAATRDPILDAGDKIYGLLQSENAADGHTITDATTTRVQISFVKINGTGNDLIAITSGAMDGQSYDYCYVQRIRFEDFNEGDFLRGASIDVPSGTTVTRQAAYDNQGATPVDLATSAILDLEGAGLAWRLRDDLEATLFDVVEGSAGGTSQLNIHAAVDEFDVDAAVSDFLNGITVDSGSTGIDVAATTAGVIQRANDLRLSATGAGELILEDSNMISEGTWAGPGVKLSDTTAEVVAYETAFGGEVSLFAAIVQANSASVRTKGVAVATSNVSADVNVTGAGGSPNIDAQLPDYSLVTFLTDVDVYLNGQLLRNGANAAANNDVYPGTTPADGDLKFEFNIKGAGAKPDVITTIVYGA